MKVLGLFTCHEQDIGRSSVSMWIEKYNIYIFTSVLDLLIMSKQCRQLFNYHWISIDQSSYCILISRSKYSKLNISPVNMIDPLSDN